MTLIIIQARMGSRRLPGKVMMEINDKPLLYYVINQIKASKFNPKIVIATTNLSKDDKIEAFAKSQNIEVFRGNEKNVLDRYFQCAKKYSIEPIVRISADSPFIDPEIIDQCIDKFMNSQVDYVSNVIKKEGNAWKEGLNGFPIGTAVEVFSFNTLEMIWKKSIDIYEREHVTEYIIRHPEQFSIGFIENSEDLSKYRIVVDNPDDFDITSKIIVSFPKNQIFNISNVVRVLKKMDDNSGEDTKN
jgi:spore coat polysaccharide biosynthesis protein SpsF